MWPVGVQVVADLWFTPERLADDNPSVSLEYAARVVSPHTFPSAEWEPPLSWLAYGVAVPSGAWTARSLDRWVEQGVLWTAKVSFPSPVPTWSASTSTAHLYRLRDGARCPVAEFPVDVRGRSLYGRSALSFFGEPLRVSGMYITLEPFRKAVDTFDWRSRHLRLKFLLAFTPDARYLKGELRCSLAAGEDELRSALYWTGLLLEKGLLPKVTMPDGRAGVLERPEVPD